MLRTPSLPLVICGRVLQVLAQQTHGIGDASKVRRMARNSAAAALAAEETSPAAARAERLRQALLK